RGRPNSPPGGDRPPPPGDPPPPPGDRSSSGGGSAPWIVVHCASETTRRDEAISGHRAALARELDDMERAGQDSLADLRRRLLAIGESTVVATTIGGLILIGLGLAPLQKLSAAVSRISPTDFRLPLDPDESLPTELAPIRQRLQHTLD